MLNAGLQSFLNIRNVENISNIRINGHCSTANLNKQKTSDCIKSELALRKVGLIQVSNSTYCAGVNQNIKAVLYNVSAPAFAVADHYQIRNGRCNAVETSASNLKCDTKRRSLIKLPFNEASSVYTLQHQNNVRYVGTVISNNSLCRQYKTVTVINNVASCNNDDIKSEINDVIKKTKEQTVKRKLQSTRLLDCNKKSINRKSVIANRTLNVVNTCQRDINSSADVGILEQLCKSPSSSDCSFAIDDSNPASTNVFQESRYRNFEPNLNSLKQSKIKSHRQVYTNQILQQPKTTIALRSISSNQQIDSTKFSSQLNSTVNDIQVYNLDQQSVIINVPDNNLSEPQTISNAKSHTVSRTVKRNRLNKQKSSKSKNLEFNVHKITSDIKLNHSSDNVNKLNAEINSDALTKFPAGSDEVKCLKSSISCKQCSEILLKNDSNIKFDNTRKCKNEFSTNKCNISTLNNGDIELKKTDNVKMGSKCENEPIKNKWKMDNGTRHEALQRIEDEFNHIKNIYYDLLPQNSAVDINEEETVVFQRNWFSSLDRSKYENFKRRTMVSRLRDDILRQIQQLRRSRKVFPNFSKDYNRAVLSAAKLCPSETAIDLLSSLEKKDISRIDFTCIKQKCCIQNCVNINLPYTRYCPEHILQCKRQVLMEKCTISDESGLECNRPVLNIYKYAPACSVHSRSNNMYSNSSNNTSRLSSTVSEIPMTMKSLDKKKSKNCSTHHYKIGDTSSQLPEIDNLISEINLSFSNSLRERADNDIKHSSCEVSNNTLTISSTTNDKAHELNNSNEQNKLNNSFTEQILGPNNILNEQILKQYTIPKEQTLKQNNNSNEQILGLNNISCEQSGQLNNNLEEQTLKNGNSDKHPNNILGEHILKLNNILSEPVLQINNSLNEQSLKLNNTMGVHILKPTNVSDKQTHKLNNYCDQTVKANNIPNEQILKLNGTPHLKINNNNGRILALNNVLHKQTVKSSNILFNLKNEIIKSTNCTRINKHRPANKHIAIAVRKFKKLTSVNTCNVKCGTAIKQIPSKTKISRIGIKIVNNYLHHKYRNNEHNKANCVTDNSKDDFADEGNGRVNGCILSSFNGSLNVTDSFNKNMEYLYKKSKLESKKLLCLLKETPKMEMNDIVENQSTTACTQNQDDNLEE